MTPPTPASSSTCVRYTENTRAPLAPSAFMVAMVSRRRSRWLFTALPTPTPPTSSAVRPTMVRNCVKRSTSRSSRGVAFERVRISQPACGKVLRACADTACAAASVVSFAGSRRR